MIAWPKIIAVAALIIGLIITAVVIEDRFFGRNDISDEIFIQQREQILQEVDQKLADHAAQIAEMDNKILLLEEQVRLSIEILEKTAEERDQSHEEIYNADTIRAIDELIRDYHSTRDSATSP